ncbi:hypothetical protein B0T26DRAFT_756780 [Lasiosphaeria miniovina]|uniref:Uncharacterized protein n=1 Tax=Lasiosphaeria miniovina TaxID=1954250 RepID=A0AA39ZT45_9PEZI|nr:uncharacterized protein B0T26DRAFT_756780 [Lasiosphaeria miniovina]KAK0703216.1 hypothetical protein B0T26DRAFT_756780 [Lasiosphaeria miniovina]
MIWGRCSQMHIQSRLGLLVSVTFGREAGTPLFSDIEMHPRDKLKRRGGGEIPGVQQDSILPLVCVGKSHLAIEFAYRIAGAQADRWVFWVYADAQARVEEGFRTIADAVLPGQNQPKANIPQLMYG